MSEYNASKNHLMTHPAMNVSQHFYRHVHRGERSPAWKAEYKSFISVTYKYSNKRKLRCRYIVLRISFCATDILVLSRGPTCFVNQIYSLLEKRSGTTRRSDDRAIPSKFDLFLNLAIVQMHFASDARRRDDWRHLSGLTPPASPRKSRFYNRAFIFIAMRSRFARDSL